jgi:hypothetical protein
MWNFQISNAIQKSILFLFGIWFINLENKIQQFSE